MRRSAWLGCAGVIFALPATARAEDAGAYLTPGFLYAPSVKAGHAPGIGFELASAIYPNGCCYAWGPLVQGELLTADGDRKTAYRGAVGAQAIWGVLGVDAGWAWRSDAGPRMPWATGPQAGAFLSLGFLSVGVRVLMPVSHGDASFDTGEVGLVLTFKTVALVYGEAPSFAGAVGLGNWGRMPAGRPLVVDDVARVAGLASRLEWQIESRLARRGKGTLAERILGIARGR